MASTVLVVSDLHLGGGETAPMCSPEGQQRLADFFGWVKAQGPGDVRLVLAGDVVDFLAEADRPGEWSAFTADEDRAVAKLDAIVGATRPVWTALADLVRAGVGLTILLGNHDIELSLPAVRRRLLETIAGRDGGRVEFLHDGEAFRAGRLLVEHGNAYDAWNAVALDQLRRVRARLSRGERAGPFDVQPGSALVVEVMNPIKQRYAFVDLLKPETSGAIPILAVLDPGVWRRAGAAIRSAAEAALRQGQYERGLPPGEARRGEGPAEAPPLPDDDALRLADELARSATGPAERGGPARERGLVQDLEVKLLFRAFRKRFEKDGTCFRVDEESDLYLDPARALASNGFDAVVFGHTHHAKRVELGGGAVYLNSGTWADLMRIPDAVYAGDEADGLRALEAFLADLRANRLEALRRPLPTFVRVALDAQGAVTDAGSWFFDGPGKVAPVTTEGVLKRLGL